MKTALLIIAVILVLGISSYAIYAVIANTDDKDSADTSWYPTQENLSLFATELPTPVISWLEGAECIPDTNERGVTAVGCRDRMRSGDDGSTVPPVVYKIGLDGESKKVLDFAEINPSIVAIDPILITRRDTILVRAYEPHNEDRYKFRVYRIDGDTEEVTLVYKDDQQCTGTYFGGRNTYDPTRYAVVAFLHYASYPSDIQTAEIIRTEDDGRTWSKVYTGVMGGAGYIYEIAIEHSKVLVAFNNGEIMYSLDGGDTWSERVDVVPGGACEGVSIFNEEVYLILAEPGYLLISHVDHLEVWRRVYVPSIIRYSNVYPAMRQAKLIGNGIVVNLTAHGGMECFMITYDKFHTVTPLLVLPVARLACHQRFSGFGNILYVGGYDGKVYRFSVPMSQTSLRLPCSRVLLEVPTLSGGEATDLSSCWSLQSEWFDELSLTVECTYHELATQGIKVHIYTSYDGSSWDTEEQKAVDGNPIFGDMPFSAGELVRKTKDISVNVRFIKVSIENLDENQSLSDIRVVATTGE